MLRTDACGERVDRPNLASCRGVPLCVPPRSAPLIVVLGMLMTALTVSRAEAAGANTATTPTAVTSLQGIHKIQHVVVIMQENRSFDHYFGTFLGANGIPMSGGHPSVCVPDPAHARCVAPYHTSVDVNHGGPHGDGAALTDIAGGAMTGFIEEAQKPGIKPC